MTLVVPVQPDEDPDGDVTIAEDELLHLPPPHPTSRQRIEQLRDRLEGGRLDSLMED